MAPWSWVLSPLVLYPEVLLSTACFMFLLAYNRRSSALPVNWPVVGMLPKLLGNLHRAHDWLTELLQESGCTFWFHGPWYSGMDILATCDPANVNHIFNTSFANYPKGDDFSQIFDILGNGIFNADDESWRSQRRRAHTLMSDRSFRCFVAKCSRDKVGKGLLPLLNQLADRGEAVDLQDVFLRLTFDLTCELVFGVDPGCLSDKFPTIPFAKAIDDAMQVVPLRYAVPGSWWKLMRRLNIGPEKKHAAAWQVIDRFIAETVSKKTRQETYDSVDLLSSYIREGAAEPDQKFLRDTAVNLMLAGRDTTGVALSWLFWLLSENPDAEKRILQELMSIPPLEYSNGAVVFDAEDTGKLVYLHAALCETLRLYPPLPFEQKAPLKPDLLPSGHEAQPGTMILVMAYSMGRMEGIWGKDCLEFRPERWISEKGKLRHEPSYKFMSFNAGPRSCLGKDVAFAQMKAAAAAMVYNFQVEIVKGHAVEPRLSVILQMKNGLMVKMKKRATSTPPP